MYTNTATTFPAELVTRVTVSATAVIQQPSVMREAKGDAVNAAPSLLDVNGWLNEMHDFDRF